MGTYGSFKIVRTPASYIISWIVHGKLEKKGFFSHFGQLLRCNLFKEKFPIKIFLFLSNQYYNISSRPVPLKLSKGRPPTLFLGADTENGKKWVLFAFRPITPMQKKLRGIQGMPSESWRPGFSENVVLFVEPELWLFKVGSKLKNKFLWEEAFFPIFHVRSEK